MSAIDRYIQDDIFNALKAFACSEVQEKNWPGFAVYCMQVGVSFIHAYRTQFGRECKGMNPAELRKLGDISRMTKAEIQDYADGKTVPSDLTDFMNHFKGTDKIKSLENEKTQLQEALKTSRARLAESEAKRSNMTSNLDRFVSDVSVYTEFSKRSHAALDGLLNNMIALQDAFKSKVESIPATGSSRAELDDLLRSYQELSSNMPATILAFQSFMDQQKTIDDLKAKNLELEGRIASATGHPGAASSHSLPLSGETIDVLKNLELEINNIYTNQPTPSLDAIRDKSSTPLDFSDIERDFGTVSELTRLFRSLLTFCKSSVLFVQLLSYTKKSTTPATFLYQSITLNKIKEVLKDINLDYLLPHLYGHKSNEELESFMLAYLKRKQETNINAFYTPVLSISSPTFKLTHLHICNLPVEDQNVNKTSDIQTDWTIFQMHKKICYYMINHLFHMLYVHAPREFIDVHVPFITFGIKRLFPTFSFNTDYFSVCENIVKNIKDPTVAESFPMVLFHQGLISDKPLTDLWFGQDTKIYVKVMKHSVEEQDYFTSVNALLKTIDFTNLDVFKTKFTTQFL